MGAVTCIIGVRGANRFTDFLSEMDNILFGHSTGTTTHRRRIRLSSCRFATRRFVTIGYKLARSSSKAIVGTSFAGKSSIFPTGLTRLANTAG